MESKTRSFAEIILLFLLATPTFAVYLNPDGQGEVLLYPFYSVEGGNDTYISVVNTRDEVKAVKVRFLEAMNGERVYEFNLYLSPYDHWSAVVTDDPEGEGARLITVDTSCTVPEIPAEGVVFSDAAYVDDSVNGPPRTREGHVQIMEQGIVTDPTLEAAAKHTAGIPADCAAISAAWDAEGMWSSQPDSGMSVNSGGLYGYGVLINVADGTDVTYRATALDDFSTSILHSAPGAENPDLSSADPTSMVYVDGVPTTFDWSGTEPSPGINAVSSVLMASQLQNDYVLDPAISAETSMIFTHPVKHYYTNDSEQTDIPFMESWSSTNSSACEQFTSVYYDRENQGFALPMGECDLCPPEQDYELCSETNVFLFNTSDALHPSSRIKFELDVLYNNGWLDIIFSTPEPTQHVLVSTSGAVFHGLPIIGFAVQKYVNGDVGGLLSNYAGLVDHVITQEIELP